MYLSKNLSKTLWRSLYSPVLAGILLSMLSFDLGAIVQAQTTGTVVPAATPERRPRYRFFEEERRIHTPTPVEESQDRVMRSSTGFNTTFLEDAIDGNQDPGALVGHNPSVEDNRGPGFSKGVVNSQSPRVPGPSISGSFGIFQTAP